MTSPEPPRIVPVEVDPLPGRKTVSRRILWRERPLQENRHHQTRGETMASRQKSRKLFTDVKNSRIRMTQ
jgi:hypothetical protein